MKTNFILNDTGGLQGDLMLRSTGELWSFGMGSWSEGIPLTGNSPCLNGCADDAECLEHELESALTMVAESNHADVLRWTNTFPQEYFARVLKFPGLSLRMLRLAAAYPEAEQLLQSFPLLLGLIAHYSRAGKWRSEHLLLCLQSKRSSILKQLGFLPRKCALTVLNKLEVSCFDAYAEHEISRWLNHSDLAELVHYPVLNLRQLEFFRRCPFMLGSRWSFRHDKVAEFDDFNGLIQILNDCCKMAEQTQQLAECLEQLKKVSQVHRFCQIHDDLVEAINRDAHLKNRVDYPSPPKPGNEYIVPITNSIDLFLEGEQQNNCVFTYHDMIVCGDYYVYRVLKPQRATLGVDRAGMAVTFEQLELSHNKPVSKGCERIIKQWLAPVFQADSYFYGSAVELWKEKQMDEICHATEQYQKMLNTPVCIKTQPLWVACREAWLDTRATEIEFAYSRYVQVI